MSQPDDAYAPGGHAFAMKHALQTDRHRVGCFLQVRPPCLQRNPGHAVDNPFPRFPPAFRD